MPTFGDCFQAIAALPRASLADIAGPGGIVVLAPHPDDESLGCGGLLAQAAAASRTVRVVQVSDGAASHPLSVTHPPARLAEIRAAELLDALGALGLAPADVVELGLPDGAVPASGCAFDDACRAVDAALDDTGATALFATWRHDPHPDHRSTWAMACAVAARRPRLKLWAYPIWGLRQRADEPYPDALPQGVRLDVRAQLAAKREAIAAHVSQTTELITDSARAFRLPQEMIAQFLAPDEVYLTP